MPRTFGIVRFSAEHRLMRFVLKALAQALGQRS